MTTPQDPAARLDTQGIASLIGCSRGHVTNRLIKRPDFPAPFINLSQKMRYWRRSEVLEFLRVTAAKAAPQRPRRSRGSTC
jgi:predicted DNA-binding transcriptional regulator AlpA